ncbi:DUF6587 family protein [Herbaspirillum autotrophicum]|uniref:DUF6587 family protein n=1 Tax=Herbaspirillum autotrophicum TaxID=180195 RepID=UPI00067A7F60|nr:DUF6587 family protein [Herbaspirillum autotrophicum]
MQNLIVAVIVVIACGVVLKRYLPRPVRLAIARQLADWCAKAGWDGMAMRLRSGVASASATTACGDCKSCAPVANPSKPATFSITPEELRKTIRR